jgi:hypothetical protein
LVTNSTAPSSSARKVTSEPVSVNDEIITTGIGFARISLSRNSRPFIFGISTSSVMTSGLRSRIMSRASNASAAQPTTSMSSCSLRMSVRTSRIMRESSTMRTLILSVI